jgi:AraC-like DNA-binding protein
VVALDIETLPKYLFSSMRNFEKNECHVRRICSDDVLVLVFKGVLRFSENEKEVEVSEAEYYIQQKGKIQDGRFKSDIPEYYYVHFVGDFSENGKLPIRGTFDLVEMKSLVDYLERARLSGASQTEKTYAFYKILLALMHGESDTSQADKIAEYIRQKRCEKIKLDDISQEFGYCKNYIIKMFKKRFGQTPHEYITYCRLDMAKNLLSSSSLSVDEISNACGFTDYVNFYKSFSKNVGCSPREYRDLAVKNERINE